jgi:hypothetical protein
MANESIHELTAAYALDALDENESETYERHLAQCERCRDDLASLAGAASALAYAVDTPPPPSALRGRILDAARAERENVVPLRSRRGFQLVAAAAAVAACAAVAFGVWAAALQRSLDRERTARAAQARAAAIVADPAAQRVELAGKPGALYVEPDGSAALVVQSLPAAPSDKTYEAWVIRGGTAHKAALFRGGGRTVVPLERAVPRGALVGVTLERAGGVDAPTSAPFVRARVT